MILLHTLILFHTIIWLIAIFGGIFFPKLVWWNIFAILPIIYVFQTLPMHKIVLEKLKLIVKSKKYETCSNYNTQSELDKSIIVKSASLLNVSEEEAEKAYETLICTEYKHPIPYITYRFKNMFKNSFQNPLSAQGMIILAYIINTILFKYRSA